MRSLRFLAAATLLGVFIPWAADARAPAERNIAGVQVDGVGRESTVSLADLKPDNRWVVIVLDAHRLGSVAYVNSLRSSGYEGKNAIVLIVGDSAGAIALSKRRALLPDARWVAARAGAGMKALNLSGTPVVLGIELDHVVWQESGMPLHAGDLAVRISDWVARR
ncbi:MAG: hypothetical protein ABI411_11830 [Tahibacter sp.]